MEIIPPEPAAETLNRQRIRSRTRRHVLTGLHAGFASLLFLAFMILLNILAMRHPWRFDWSQHRLYELSEKTKSLLTGLSNPVRVTVFIQPDHEIYHAVYDDALNLLREYDYTGGQSLTVERVDPDRHLGRAEEIMARYAIDRANVVIFEYDGRHRTVPAESITEMDFLPVARGGLPRPLQFRGEQVFSSAIFSLIETNVPRVYFTQGHGERDFDDHDPYVGLSMIGREIRREQVELLPFSFAEGNALPADAAALIVAGPTRSFAAKEIERIMAYANRTGRLLLMLNAETDAGFAPALESWGIRGENNILVDPVRTVSGFDAVIGSYQDHPITERLHNLNSIFYWPRALLLKDGNGDPVDADKPRATPLAFSSSRAWADFDLNQQPYQFDAGRDVRGRLPVAVAVERGGSTPVSMSVSRSRVVVFGDVDFVSNSGMSGANGDLFMNALNWVLDREQRLAIGPKPVEEVRLLIHRKQRDRLFWFVVIGIPSFTALTGVLVWWRRRS